MKFIDRLINMVDKYDAMKDSIVDKLYYISPIEILSYIFILIFFLFLISSAIYFKNKKPIMIMIIILAFTDIILAPIIMKFVISPTFRQIDITNIEYKKLYFSDITIAKANIKNNNKIGLKSCKISALIYRQNKTNHIKNLIYSLQPIREKSIIVEGNLKVGEDRNISIVIEKLDSLLNIEVKLSGKCI